MFIKTGNKVKKNNRWIGQTFIYFFSQRRHFNFLILIYIFLRQYYYCCHKIDNKSNNNKKVNDNSRMRNFQLRVLTHFFLFHLNLSQKNFYIRLYCFCVLCFKITSKKKKEKLFCFTLITKESRLKDLFLSCLFCYYVEKVKDDHERKMKWIFCKKKQ